MGIVQISQHIVKWLEDYRLKSKMDGFIIGISGGIDSAVVSTLAAKTGAKTILASLPLQQAKSQIELAQAHIDWLCKNFTNVLPLSLDLTDTFEIFLNTMGGNKKMISKVNLKSRLRMCVLYFYASENNCLVTGTGNKIEDFGIGFFTKYGDGGVDISPIADLTKTQVRSLATFLGIAPSILEAHPTDGLWDTETTDESQIGATYLELEWAMDIVDNPPKETNLTSRQQEVLQIYQTANKKNNHKIKPIPVCIIPKNIGFK